jgi:CRISPR-associated protein Csm1
MCYEEMRPCRFGTIVCSSQPLTEPAEAVVHHAPAKGQLMIILGDISGIQNYLFDVAEEGGGQAQRLRARSFFVQLLAETAAVRVLRAVGWPLSPTHLLLSGAGKFLLRGSSSPEAAGLLSREQQTINEWLVRVTRGELRLTLAWDDSAGPDAAAYVAAQRTLQRAKARPWGPIQGDTWEAARLVLAPLGTPCSLCRHAPAEEDETDRDTGEKRRVCRTCAANRDLGQRLPRARWLLIRDTVQSAEFEMLGLGVTVSNEARASVGADVLAVANLRDPETRPPECPPDKFLPRRLMAHVPVNEEGSPVWFTELAQRAQGDRLLAVLKADADSLGVRFEKLLQSSGLEAVAGFSDELDTFFAGRLRDEIVNDRSGRWRSIYTIFAGGDDLVMVGPWDVMLDFAGRLHELFYETFGSQGLTISAGLALIKPKRPIKAAVAEVERLLEQAKTEKAPGASEQKDQFAAFGQLWKWGDHAAIIRQARQLTAWVSSGKMERGWLHTLLELAESRDPLASSRLAYHVARNYRDKEVRSWGKNLSERFGNKTWPEVRYLPAVIRFALTATRARAEED